MDYNLNVDFFIRHELTLELWFILNVECTFDEMINTQ